MPSRVIASYRSTGSAGSLATANTRLSAAALGLPASLMTFDAAKVEQLGEDDSIAEGSKA